MITDKDGNTLELLRNDDTNHITLILNDGDHVQTFDLDFFNTRALIDALNGSRSLPTKPVDDSWDPSICWNCGSMLESDGTCNNCD